jgi:hypothetical protein
MARKSRKNPWAAAVLNLLVLGLGYLYLGKRREFAWTVIVSQVFLAAGFMLAPAQGVLLSLGAVDPASGLLIFVGLLMLDLAFAWDAWILATE